MAAPFTTQTLTRSPSAGRKMFHETDTLPTDEKYSRLEDLIRQTLSLAGEIAENASGQRPARASTTLPGHAHIPGECIVLRKTSQTVSEPTIELCRRPSSRRSRQKSRLRALNNGEEEDRTTLIPPLMQEPFSPGSLAMSLDAVVEGKGSEGLSCLENLSCLSDKLLDSPPLTRATTRTSQGPTSPRCPTPGSMLGHDLQSDSASEASAPIDIPGKPRYRPPTSHRTSSVGRGPGEDPPSPPAKWHVRIVPVSLRDPVHPSSPPRTPAPTAFIKLEAVFPYRFFSDGNNAARWSGEGSYIIIGRPPMDDCQSPLNLDESEHEFGPATARSLKDFIDEWHCQVDETVAEREEWREAHAGGSIAGN